MISRFIFWILLAAVVCDIGCARLGPNPLTGWKGVGSITWNGLKTPGEQPLPASQTITDDYQDYIRKLPTVKGHFVDRHESYYIHRVTLYEDGTGQRAVEISILLNGIDWKHVLIYSKEGERKKLIKYASGRYSC
jgi:hypothetical protein